MELLNRCKCGKVTNYSTLCVRCSGDKDKSAEVSMEELMQYEDCEEFLDED